MGEYRKWRNLIQIMVFRPSAQLAQSQSFAVVQSNTFQVAIVGPSCAYFQICSKFRNSMSVLDHLVLSLHVKHGSHQ